MKRLLPLLLIALVAGACGSTPATQTPATESPVAEVTPSPTPCAVAPLPCAPERVLVLAGPDTKKGYPNGMILVFENGTGFSHTSTNSSYYRGVEDAVVQVWNWGAEATAPLFAAFDAATPLLTVPAGSTVVCGVVDEDGFDYRVRGRWCPNDLTVERNTSLSMTSIDGILFAVNEISIGKTTGDMWSPSVADPNTLVMIGLDRSGTITLDGAAIQAALSSLLEGGSATAVTDRFLAAVSADEDRVEITGYNGILPDWLDPQSVLWIGLFDAQGGG